MTRTRNTGVEPQDERGSAALAVLLLLMMMSALAAALNMSGQTETLISRRQRAATQATAAAEAGLNHAVAVASAYIYDWQANGFQDRYEAIDALLVGPDSASGTVDTDADNGSLGTRTGIDAAEAIPIGAQLNIAAGINATYEAFVMDDDASAPNEPAGDLLADENATLIVRATGYGPDNTKVVLKALIGSPPVPAVFVDGDLIVSGTATIEGSDGNLHANGDLLISGGGTSVTGVVTASGAYAGSHSGSGGADEVSYIETRASDYLADADFILTSSGTVTQPDGTVVCDASIVSGACKDSWGWDFKGTSGWETYEDGADSKDNKTFYVEGGVTIGDFGSSSNPLQMTIIAEGSIMANGSPHISPDIDPLLFVTDGDLEISGPLEMHAMGQMRVHEQLKLNGDAVIIGPIRVDNAVSVDDLVTENTISGNPTITYDGGVPSDMFRVIGWRDVRDDD